MSISVVKYKIVEVTLLCCLLHCFISAIEKKLLNVICLLCLSDLVVVCSRNKYNIYLC